MTYVKARKGRSGKIIENEISVGTALVELKFWGGVMSYLHFCVSKICPNSGGGDMGLLAS